MTKKLNICLMNDSFPPTVDGVATCVANYASVIESGVKTMVCVPLPCVGGRIGAPSKLAES